MKGEHPRITLLGSNSGNNLGDAAILAATLDVFTEEFPNAEFYVPTTHPGFTDRNYGEKYNVHGVNVMPWTGSVRLFGIPTMIAMAKSDAALIGDGIIFGKKFFNPLFNFLITLLFLAPWAKLTKCKLICFCCGIGPFPTKISEWAAKYVINSCELVIMRDKDSEQLARDIGVTKPIHVTGDAAFLNKVNCRDSAKKLAQRLNIDLSRPTLGINVTKYIDRWLPKDRKVSDRGNFIELVAEAAQQLKEEIGEELQFLVFSTHPMDEEVCTKLSDLIGGTVIENSTLLSHDIQSLMRECDLFIGMRVHSLILASSVAAPVIGMIYAPKVRSFLNLIESPKFGLELNELTSEILALKLKKGWQCRSELQGKQQQVVDRLKDGARGAAKTVRDSLLEAEQVVAEAA